MIRYLLPLGIFLVLAVFFAVGLQRDPSEIPSPLVGKPAPEFQLPRLHQPERAIDNAALEGEVSVVNVWASWCVGCREEHEVVKALANSGAAPVYGLNYKDAREDALRWLSHFGDPYTAIAVDRDGDVGIDWGVYGVPETFILDADGVIRYKHIGPMSETDLREKILPVIRELKTEARS
ncbi:DsbE family thiol:disulfide interchange protein [Ectothiorhodospiraceae bacterium WFHF3C12]|nr:DsbE family thiol:disulfide interchange protein [Ectothiorhodospiraceae bacterium WFHF3C12]